MKKILITGGLGFIGRYLIDSYLNKNYFVYVLVKEGSLVNINVPNLEYIYCNPESIQDLPKLINVRDIESCIHLAWTGSFGEDRKNVNTQLNNIKFSTELVYTLQKLNIKKFIGAGTVTEFEIIHNFFNPKNKLSLVSNYAISKHTSHLLTKILCNELNIHHNWCYLPNTFGIGNTTNNFVNMAIVSMLSDKIPEFTSGEQYYDFVYITDTVNGIFEIEQRGKNFQHYYIGSNNPKKLKDYIFMIRDTINPGLNLNLGAIPSNGMHLDLSFFDTTKLINDTKYKPIVNFNEGIKLTYNWVINNRIGAKNDYKV